jgi:hypothetical protein
MKLQMDTLLRMNFVQAVRICGIALRTSGDDHSENIQIKDFTSERDARKLYCYNIRCIRHKLSDTD